MNEIAPPPYRPPKPQGTAIPVESRDDSDERKPDLRARSMLLNRLGLGGLQDMTIDRAAPWVIVGVALLGLAWSFGYSFSHSQWGWGSCPHRIHLETVRELQKPDDAPKSGGAR